MKGCTDRSTVTNRLMGKKQFGSLKYREFALQSRPVCFALTWLERPLVDDKYPFKFGKFYPAGAIEEVIKMPK